MEHGTATGWDSLRRPPPGEAPPQADGDQSGAPSFQNGYVQSQLAGLSAIIRLAEAPATTQAHSERLTAGRLSAGRQSLARITGLPLLVILTIQVVLSARLIGSNSAFNDEALYLWAGRLEWSGWLHGTAVPHFQDYFSGAPVIYPPLAGIANAAGGLTGARLMSLLFMLGATVLLHGLTKRLFDPRSANFAAALFALLGPTQFLGAFATYDALAVFLLALATWIGVRSAGCRPAWLRVGLVALAAGVMVVADASKYAATLFDPVVLIAIACFHWHALGRRPGAIAGIVAVAGTLAGTAAGLAIGGPGYWTGIAATTVARAPGNWPAFGIVSTSLGWAGVIVLLAIFGATAASSASQSAAVRILVWTLAGASLLAPAEQARIHVFTSLFKHVTFGAWFAAPVAGYALTAFMQAIPAAKAKAGVRTAVTVIMLSGLAGVLLAADHFGNWADTRRVVPMLTTAIRDHPGRLLVDAAPPFDYYLQRTEPWQAITALPSYSGASLSLAIKQRQFAVIMLSYAAGGGDCGNDDPAVKKTRDQCLHNVDLKALADILTSGGYELVTKIPYKTTSFASTYMIWARQGTR